MSLFLFLSFNFMERGLLWEKVSKVWHKLNELTCCTKLNYAFRIQKITHMLSKELLQFLGDNLL